MERLVFKSSPAPTLGIEIELALVDATTLALRPANAQLLSIVPPEIQSSVKPELMQSYVEINSTICQTVAEADADLRPKLRLLEKSAEQIDLQLLWSGTHPFSSWQDQAITPNERYLQIVQLLQDTARQLVTFGLHFHVGVDSGDKAIMICDRILRHLPTLLAASANSPFWEGRPTGLHSYRSKVMDGLPTAGLPPLMRNWSEYVWLVNHLVDTGFIQTIREIWWDVRPHHNFGTVEVRICDVPASFDDALSLAALVQCLVKSLSDEIDRGTYQHDCHPMLIRQNKWRASRYGLDAQLVNSDTYQLRPARTMIIDLIDQLQPTAQELKCVAYLERIRALAAGSTGSIRQLQLWEETHDSVEVVRHLIQHSRLNS